MDCSLEFLLDLSEYAFINYEDKVSYVKIFERTEYCLNGNENIHAIISKINAKEMRLEYEIRTSDVYFLESKESILTKESILNIQNCKQKLLIDSIKEDIKTLQNLHKSKNFDQIFDQKTCCGIKKMLQKKFQT